MLSNLDMIDTALALIITLQSTQNTDLSSYNSLLSYIKGPSTVFIISNEDDIVNPYSLLLD